MPNFFISTFYHFFPLIDLDQVKKDLKDIAQKTDTLGLMIIGAEGMNSTVASSSEQGLAAFKANLQEHFKIEIHNNQSVL